MEKKIRISNRQHHRLKIASVVYDTPIAQIVRKAIRKFRKENVVVSRNIDDTTTTNGAVLSISGIPDDVSMAEIRTYIKLYLDMHPMERQETFKPDLTEGVDYVLKEVSA